jgi:hypothetical protein
MSSQDGMFCVAENNRHVNVVAEWLTLLLYIHEVPGSNLSPETGYTD